MKPRLSREDWLRLGLLELAQHGAESLKLAEICKSAGVTRGSFYHHFEDHDAFLSAVTEHWIEVQTEALIAQIPDDASHEDQEKRLTELTMAMDYRAELGIRELARRSGRVAELVRSTDNRRTAFLAAIYSSRFGLSEEEAMISAKLEYATFLGILLINFEIDETEQTRLHQAFAERVNDFYRENP